MKAFGLIGGLGPESTIDYYRKIITTYRARLDDAAYPPLIINSLDLKEMLALMTANRLADVVDVLVRGIVTLANAGADTAAITANTPHAVFDDVRKRSPLPLISIVETTCREAQQLGMRCVGLFGTAFTMEGKFYPDVFSASGITVVAPVASEQAWIHEKYFSELVKRHFRQQHAEQAC